MRVALSGASLLKASVVLASAFTLCFARAGGARNVQTEPAAASAAARAEREKSHGDFRKAAGTPAEAPTAFEFESGGFSYHISANGNGRRVKGDKTRRYNLHLGGGESIRRLYFSEYDDDDLLLLCEVEGEASGASVLVTRLEQPSMRALWKQTAPSDGVDALRRGGSLYLAGTGFVGRLELKNGAYAWSHRDRRDEGGEEAEDEEEGAEVLIPHGRYGLAEVSDDTVTFSLAQGADSPRPKTVRVNRKTGKIISVE